MKSTPLTNPEPLFLGAENLSQSKKIYSVSLLNREVRTLLEGGWPSLWLEGEISNFKNHSSGHMYLSLKDEKSQIPAVFFSRQNQTLKFEPKDGLQVLVLGRVSLYEPRGQYQFYIERMEPKGMGALQLAFLQLKEKLEREGLFGPEHKKPIPCFPKAVGVVTSPTGAAIRDILNVVSRRFCGTEILLYPVQVQGAGAAEQIAAAIRAMNEIPDLDVLIVGRGGGSLEDLWAFNEEIVARAIFDSRIPVISAVGHEIDWTISDLVADLRAPTPSAAAELVTQSSVELLKNLRDLRLRMRHAILNSLKEKKALLDSLSESYAFKQPKVLIQQFSQRVDELLRQLQNYSKTLVQQKGQQLGALAGRLHALSPLAILERGYSVTFNREGKILKDARTLQKGENITTRLWHGLVKSQVTEIVQKEEKLHG